MIIDLMQAQEPSVAASTAARVEDRAPVVWVAGFWRRAVAALIDTLIVLPAALAMIWAAGRMAALALPPIGLAKIDAWLDLILAGDVAVIGVLGLAAAVAAVYLLVFQVLGARTLGMRLLGLRIIDVYGDAPSALRVLARTVGYFIGVATGGLGFLWIAFDREKRGLHDWLAGTYVVKPPPKATR